MLYPTRVIVEKALNISPYYKEYSTFSKIISATNEDLMDSYLTIEINEKNVLVPASSGDQFLTAKIMGAKKIVIYDVNLFTKFFTFLKIGASKYFSNYDDFQKFIIPQFNNSNSFLNFEDFNKISDYLPDDISDFWYQYLKQCNQTQLYNLIPTLSLRHLEALKHFTPFYSQEGYKQYKSIFDSLEYPEFLFCDLKRLPNRLQNTDDKFDFVDCSNIIECEIYKDLKSLITLDDYSENQLQEKWISFIQNQLSTIMNPNGKIIVDYRLNLPHGILYKTDLLLNHDKFNTHVIKSNYPEEKSAVVVYQKK